VNTSFVETYVGHKVYLVGGAVRDMVMGIEPKDYDYVTLCSPDELMKRGWEHTGKMFPVFRHKDLNNVELAIGRTERKVAEGHNGFEWGLAKSLVDDLLRRDLTINAMAMDAEGVLYDPFGGREDIKAKLLRPVSPAFSEDPLRSFRAAKFAARYNFNPSASLLRAMREVAPELCKLSVERVREEMMAALLYDYADKFFEVLRDGGSLDYWFPELKAGLNVPAGPAHAHGTTTVFEHSLLALKAAEKNEDIRLMALTHDFGKAVTSPDILPHHYGHENVTEPLITFSRRMNFSDTLTHKLVTHTKMHMRYHIAEKMRPCKQVVLYRHVRRFQSEFLAACVADSRGRVDPSPRADNTYLAGLFLKLNNVDLSACKGQDEVVRLLEKAASEYKKEMKG
jgi:tRNA nucleotidyltransferase (CCA-adding enzyme)